MPLDAIANMSVMRIDATQAKIDAIPMHCRPNYMIGPGKPIDATENADEGRMTGRERDGVAIGVSKRFSAQIYPK
jgi:hypothetical protein